MSKLPSPRGLLRFGESDCSNTSLPRVASEAHAEHFVAQAVIRWPAHCTKTTEIAPGTDAPPRRPPMGVPPRRMSERQPANKAQQRASCRWKTAAGNRRACQGAIVGHRTKHTNVHLQQSGQRVLGTRHYCRSCLWRTRVYFDLEQWIEIRRLVSSGNLQRFGSAISVSLFHRRFCLAVETLLVNGRK